MSFPTATAFPRAGPCKKAGGEGCIQTVSFAATLTSAVTLKSANVAGATYDFAELLRYTLLRQTPFKSVMDRLGPKVQTDLVSTEQKLCVGTRVQTLLDVLTDLEVLIKYHADTL